MYVSDDQDLIIAYPSDWVFLGEEDEFIKFRSFYEGDAAIGITTFTDQPQGTDLEGFMIEQLQSLVKDGAAPNKLINYGEIKMQEHSDYLIVTGNVSFYPKVPPFGWFARVYTVAIQFGNRIVFVSAGGTSPLSCKNAIDEIIEGLTFQEQVQ